MADLTWKDTPNKCQAQVGSLLFCVEHKPDGWECAAKTRSGELEILARKLPTASAGKQVIRQRLADAEKQSGKKAAKRVKPAAEKQNDGDDRYQEAQPHLVDISDGCVCGYVNGVRWVADQKGKIVFLKPVSDAVKAQVQAVVKQHLARRGAKPADVPVAGETAAKTSKKPAKKAAKTASKKDCGCEHPAEAAEEKKTAKVVSKKGPAKKAASRKAESKKAESKKAVSKAASKKAPSKKAEGKKAEGVDTPAKKPPIRPDSAPKQTEDDPLDAKVLAAMSQEPIKMAELLKTIKGAAKADVAQSVKRLVAAGQVQVSGRTRGTQYSLGGPTPATASKKSGKKAARKKSDAEKDEEDAPAPDGPRPEGALRWINVEGRRQAATSEGSWQIMPEGSSFSLYYLNPSGASRFIETGEVGRLEQIAGERHARGAMGEAPRSMSAVERLFDAELNN